jgi:hypothetical protein
VSVINGVSFHPDGTPLERSSDYFGGYIITSGTNLVAVYDSNSFTPRSAAAHFSLAVSRGVGGKVKVFDFAMWEPSKDDRLLAQIRFVVGTDGRAQKFVKFLDDPAETGDRRSASATSLLRPGWLIREG